MRTLVALPKSCLSLSLSFSFLFELELRWIKSNVNTPCRDVLFLDPRIGGASILTPSNALTVTSMSIAYSANRANSGHQQIPTGATPPRTAAYELDKLCTPSHGASSAAHSTASSSHSLRIFKRPPTPTPSSQKERSPLYL